MGKGTKSDRAKALKKRQGGAARREKGKDGRVGGSRAERKMEKQRVFNDF
jgi:hypothetical protein